jgi:hypothetical protein
MVGRSSRIKSTRGVVSWYSEVRMGWSSGVRMVELMEGRRERSRGDIREYHERTYARRARAIKW